MNAAEQTHGESREWDEPLHYRGMSLDVITPEDHRPLYDLFVGLDEAGIRWRFRGSTPSYDDFTHSLWSNIYAHYLVRETSTGSVIAYVCAYAPQIRDRYCYVAIVGLRDTRSSGRLAFAMALFIETLMSIAPFRKLYAEAAESNFRQYRSAVQRGVFVIEGTYSEHEWLAGRYEDVHILALTRQTWGQIRNRYGFTGPFNANPE